MKKLNTEREPVMVATAISVMLETFIAMLVTLDILPWNSEQIASVNNFIVAGVALAALIAPMYFYARQRVTPVADPRLADGKPAQLVKKE